MRELVKKEIEETNERMQRLKQRERSEVYSVVAMIVLIISCCLFLVGCSDKFSCKIVCEHVATGIVVRV